MGVTISSNGKAQADIIIDINAPTAVKFAAEELKKYIHQISSASLDIKNTPGNRINIILGTAKSPLIKPLKDKFASDFNSFADTAGYAVRNQDGNIYIFADNPKGVLNGVYFFLQKNSDIIWPRPANQMVIFTPEKTLNFTEVDYIDIPQFRVHYFAFNYGRGLWSKDLQYWSARQGYSFLFVNKHNRALLEKLGFYKGFYDEYGKGHNLCKEWFPAETIGKQHPEYFAVVEGKRFVENHSQLCYSSEEMTQAYIREMLKKMKTLPEYYNTIKISMADSDYICECDNCRAPIKTDDGLLQHGDEAFASTRFFIFFNKIARAFKKHYPKKKLLTYAYLFASIPPKVKLEDNIDILYCPYIRNDKEPLSGPSNKKWMNRSKAWLANTRNVALREYYFSGAPFPRALANIMVQDLRFFAKNNIPMAMAPCSWSDDDYVSARGDIMKGHEFWDITAIEMWTLSRLMWNPSLDPDKLRKDYLQRTYHKAAPAMIKYYKYIHDSWLNDPAPSVFNDHPVSSTLHYIVKKKLTDKCRAALKEAVAATKNPKILALIKANSKVFEKWVDLARKNQVVPEKVTKTLKSAKIFDFNDSVWKDSHKLAPMKVMGRPKRHLKLKTDINVIHNGRTLYVKFKCYQNTDFLAATRPKGSKHNLWTGGDHIEIFLGGKRNYYHLSFDYRANTYDAIGLDTTWNGNWKVKTKVDADGWGAVIAIPLKDIEFDMLKGNKLKVLFYRAGHYKKGRIEHSSSGAGQVHDMASFGELIFDLE